jgi:hypothetical protein
VGAEESPVFRSKFLKTMAAVEIKYRRDVRPVVSNGFPTAAKHPGLPEKSDILLHILRRVCQD